MKIAVCLPSFNEVNNIQNITRIVDQGLAQLKSLYPEADPIIVNVDSNSDDGTVTLFNETETENLKHSIVVAGEGGKGKNILEFCRYVLDNDVDFCLTIDTDITSANPEWVVRLTAPLIQDDAIYATPLYERSRFEGSSTNHFTFPLVYALTGHVVRQPIAGDFAFSRSMATAILETDLTKDESIQKYGIDIFMTMTAIRFGGHIANVNLDKKLHTPSFNKLEYMFPQIAASVLMSSIDEFTFTGPADIGEESNILPDLNFDHKEAAKEMFERAQNTIESIQFQWLDGQLLKDFRDVVASNTEDQTKIINLWTDLLTEWFNYFHRLSLSRAEVKQAGQELLPFFVLRATNFWFWAETVEVAEVEKAIRQQAELLRNKFKAV